MLKKKINQTARIALLFFHVKSKKLVVCLSNLKPPLHLSVSMVFLMIVYFYHKKHGNVRVFFLQEVKSQVNSEKKISGEIRMKPTKEGKHA